MLTRDANNPLYMAAGLSGSVSSGIPPSRGNNNPEFSRNFVRRMCEKSATVSPLKDGKRRRRSRREPPGHGEISQGSDSAAMRRDQSNTPKREQENQRQGLFLDFWGLFSWRPFVPLRGILGNQLQRHPGHAHAAIVAPPTSPQGLDQTHLNPQHI